MTKDNTRRRFDVTIECVQSDDAAGFADVFALLLALHREGGYAPLVQAKAAASCYGVIAKGMTFLARVDGRPVGTLALVALPFWYSDAVFLQDAWMFVCPTHRRANVGVALLKAARAEGERRGLIVFVTVNNPDRRPKRTAASIESQVAGFVPLGHTLKLC